MLLKEPFGVDARKSSFIHLSIVEDDQALPKPAPMAQQALMQVPP
jgi:hypothetical protein